MQGNKFELELIERGFRATFTAVDVTKEKEVEKWVKNCVSRFGLPQVLINNAARFVFGRVEDVSDKDWDTVFAVNIKG